jgi:hypothetical protein
MIKKVLFLCLAVLFLLNCGKKGPLKLEPEKNPGKIFQFTIEQIGSKIKLEWSFPRLLLDKKTTMDMNQVKKIRIFHSEKKIPPKKFRKKSSVILKTNIQNVQKKNQSYWVEIPFKTKNLHKKTHYFALRYTLNRKKSPLSPIQTIQTMIPIQPIKDLSLTKENKIIKLKWSKPILNISKKPVAYIRGYKIYRKVPGRKYFEVLNREDVLQEYYEDADTGLDGDYFYYVSSIYSQNIQSDPSNTVSVVIKDIFPPDPPANLVAFRAEDSIFLTWESVKDRDFSYYKIFRKSTTEGEFKILVKKVSNNYFKDKNVNRGTLYSYFVTAVDNKGNESKNSNRVQERF